MSCSAGMLPAPWLAAGSSPRLTQEQHCPRRDPAAPQMSPSCPAPIVLNLHKGLWLAQVSECPGTGREKGFVSNFPVAVSFQWLKEI